MNAVWTEYLHPRYHAGIGRVRRMSRARNPRNSEIEWAREVTAAYVEAFGVELLQAYRWTIFEPLVELDASRRSLQVSGRVILRDVAKRLELGLGAVLSPQWRVNVEMATPEENAIWHRLNDPVTQVWREWCGGISSPALSTELLRRDGPVQVLVRAKGCTLIRCMDGTVGWSNQPIVDEGHGPEGRAMAGRRRTWSGLARSFLGTPYEIGGTTRRGIDCSGLIQRIYQGVLGTTIPRHSANQVALLRPAAPTSLREGRLLLAETPSAKFHVGILIRHENEWLVVHASSSRREVVAEPVHEGGWF